MLNKGKITAFITAIAVTITFSAATDAIKAKNVSAAGKSEWDCIYFGNYYQNDTNGDGKINFSDKMEPIRWRILQESGNYALLLSDKILDAGKYNNAEEDCTWENCNIRKWLNATFYNTAFNTAEREAIQTRTVINDAYEDSFGAYGGNTTKDKVFLLSLDEILNGYGFEYSPYNEKNPSRTVSDTAYAATKPGMYSNTESADTWWLRGPGWQNDTAACVLANGIISEMMPVDATAGIRPVIYVNLSDASLWSDAGTAVTEVLSEDGEINPEGNGAWDVPVIDGETENPQDTPIPPLDDPQDTEPDESRLNYLKYTKNTTGGTESYNSSANDYTYLYADTVKSYLSETASGYLRVETTDDKVYAEEYSYDYELLSVKEIGMELPLFGGYFSGTDYNFMVFGQENPYENDSTEIMRVVKYDKEWNRLDSQSVYGANTIIPFEAGSLRMTETQGMLFIHTCHQMYASDDGLNHQANMTYVIAQNTMSVIQSWYGIMNVNYGYVSHSFNQFVRTDGAYLYRLDHGDAYPRSVVLTKSNINNITNCSYTELIRIAGETGENATGVSVGGFELAGNRLVSAGNSCDQTDSVYDPISGVRNIFVSSTDNNLTDTNIRRLTDYDEYSDISVGNPHLVKAGENELYVLWEETDSDNFTLVKIAKIDSSGELIGEIHTIYAKLSDCAPLYTSQDEIVWYVTYGGSPVFYHLPADKLEECEFKGRINIEDCTVTLTPQVFEYTDYHEYIPEVHITYGSYALRENEDYTVSYSANSSLGTARAVFKGEGIFTGEVSKDYSIVSNKADNDNPSAGEPSTGNNPGNSNGSGGSGIVLKDSIVTKTRNYSSSGTSSSSKKSVKKPGKVKGVAAYKYGKKIVVYWYSKNGAKGYQVQYSANKKFAKKKSKNVSSTIVSLKVKKSKFCYIRVRAYKKASGRKVYGKWSKVKKVKIK